MLLQDYPTLRARLYQVYAALGLGSAAFAAYMGAVGDTLPKWYIGAVAALGVIGTGLGFVASANIASTGDSSDAPWPDDVYDPAQIGETENQVGQV